MNASRVLRARKRRVPRTTAERTADKNVMRGRVAERRSRRSGRGNLCRAKPHERHRRETKPEGPREEQGARRLRKPGGAAQPGEANPVQVASRCLKRWRGREPHERRPRKRRSGSGETLEQSEVHERTRVGTLRFDSAAARGKASQASPSRGGQGHRGIANPYGGTARRGNTLKVPLTA
jgi:hypothetical protein